MKMSERFYTDVDGSQKVEYIWLILDYQECKWKKIKTTDVISPPPAAGW
jgi:hypothetical protein